MIDEDLYKIATDELNSGERRPEVWARACALASDDHDEARFLYTNLRVEEMLNKDGKQRTFSTNEQHRSANFSNAVGTGTDAVELEQAVSFGSEPIDSHEDSLDSTVAQVESDRAGLESVNTPLRADEPGSIEMGDLDSAASASGTDGSGTDVLSDKVVEFDDETMAELAELSEERSNDSTTVSSINGKSQNADQNNESAADTDGIADSVLAAAEAKNGDHMLTQDLTSASAAISAQASEINYQPQTNRLDMPEISGDVVSDHEDHDATTDFAYADSTLNDAAGAANDDAASELQYAQTYIEHNGHTETSQLIDEDSSIGTSSALDTGVGRSFMVFNRHGSLKSIKRGVSWPALFITFPWLLSKALFGTAIVYGCLWLVSLGSLLISANSWFVAGADASINIKLWTGAFALLAIIGLFYIPFRYGNRWVAEKLQNRGFKYEGLVSAENKLDAVNRLIRYNQEYTR